MIVIEKGVPLPQKQQHKKRKSIYPFDEMEVGDSFLIQENDKKVRASACVYAKRTGKKFSIRKTGTAHRCWRLE